MTAALTSVQADAFAGTDHQRPRPTRHDRDIRRASAEALMPAIERWAGEAIDGRTRERLIDEMASFSYANGYELAREFEREGFAPDAELVELLDNVDSHKVYTEAVRVWLVEADAKPRLAVGAVVAIPARMKEHDGVVGEIVRIDERMGEYLIFCESLGHVREGMGTHGLIFPWEEVEERNAAAEGSPS